MIKANKSKNNLKKLKTVLIFVLVLVMCMGSAAVAMRKLVDADPAEIF